MHLCKSWMQRDGRAYLTYFKSQRAYRLVSIFSRPHDGEKIVFGTRAHADNVTEIFLMARVHMGEMTLTR